MIAIPLSSIALYTSILTIFASGFTWLIELCDFTLKWSIVIMNESLNMIAELPYSVSENIYINTTETILLSIYILLFILLIVHKYRLVLKYVLLLMIIHLLYIENKESSNIRRNYISHNSIMPIYTYRFNNELRHVVPSSIEVKRLNKFLKSWANIDYFKHRVYLYDKNESVIIKNGIHKILIADRKRIASVNINKVDYLISNSWYVSNKIEARKIISNKDIDSNIAINVSKTGYLEF
jgi:hypothetical protein